MVSMVQKKGIRTHVSHCSTSTVSNLGVPLLGGGTQPPYTDLKQKSPPYSNWRFLKKSPPSLYATSRYGVATMSRLLKIIGLFCKRAL